MRRVATTHKPQSQRARARGGQRKSPASGTTLLTPEVEAGVCAAIEKSVPLKYAALANGISERTLHEWLRRGENGEAPYDAFAAAVECAKGKAVVSLTDKALAGGAGSSQATFLLERRYRDEYGAAQRIEHAGSISLPTAQEDRIAEAIRGNPKALDGVQAVITRFADKDKTDADGAR